MIKLTQEIADQIRQQMDKSTKELAFKYNVSQRCIQAIRSETSYRNQVIGKIDGTVLDAVPEGFIVKKVSTQLEADGTTKSQWLGSKEEHALGDIRESVPEGHRIIGMSTLVSGDGTTTAQWIKTKVEQESAQDLLVRLINEMPTRVPARKGSIKKSKKPSRDDLVSIYPLGDPHVGALCWKDESGADFDLKIAEELMVGAMRDLVLRGPRTKKALILNLGDYFHFDSNSMETTKGGNRLDVDGRSAKVLAIGLKIMYTLIDTALEHHDEVIVDNRIGNHDGHTSLMLSLALGAYYHNEPRVTIPASVRHRSYYEFGKVAIGVTHGDKAKGQDLESLMASEEPEMWGRTKHRYIMCGHVHHQTVKEYRGVRIESFRSLVAKDSWHAGQGYMAGRDMHRIVMDVNHGEVSREIVNTSALLSR